MGGENDESNNVEEEDLMGDDDRQLISWALR